VDPFAILGVDPGVSERELAAAFRAQAKRWHPDRRGGDGDGRMAALNEAYAAARRQLERVAATSQMTVRLRPSPGLWLPQALRERLGWELLAALADRERVDLVVDAGGPGRGPARLVVTDRRLLWLLEDAVSARVDWVRFSLIADATVRRPLLRRGRRSVRLQTKTGRRVVFGDLGPPSAAAIVERVHRGQRIAGCNAL
jgi:hypothetical protein